jgi:hypothetical protein
VNRDTSILSYQRWGIACGIGRIVWATARTSVSRTQLQVLT